ncbi:peptidase S28 [Neoconidiobolus thromboides FSU 785]|nr:peptidase S28 [Neoconidiobolus thromboides FSU 785]
MFLSVMAEPYYGGLLKVDNGVLKKFKVFRSGGSTERWFNQSLTHDGGPDSRKFWKQRYFVNDQYYQPGGPAFLYISGEDELDGSWAQYSLLAKAAEEHNGVVYALEHRFYGQSQPKPDLSLESLKYLTSDLAIGDLATFVLNITLPQSNTNRTNSLNTKWIIGGGSYAGNIAAWARSIYPNIFYGAIASSAPVEAKENFYEYDLQVQKSIVVNGGQDCLNYYIENIKAIDHVLFSGDEVKIKSLKEKFNCADVDNRYFVSSLGQIGGIVQDSNNTNINIANHCKSLYLKGSGAEKLDDFASNFKKSLGKNTCKSFTDFSRYNSTHQLGPNESTRQWFYQSCNEFGYWQVAPPKNFPSLKSRLFDVAFNRESICSAVFGPKGPAYPNINETNKKYKGKSIKFDRLLFVNGELDPWTPLSVTNSTDKLQSIIIKGAAHCADIAYPDSSDTQYIAEAKRKVLEFIRNILK